MMKEYAIWTYGVSNNEDMQKMTKQNTTTRLYKYRGGGKNVDQFLRILYCVCYSAAADGK